MSRRSPNRAVRDAAAVRPFMDAMERSFAHDNTDWDDDDPRWEEFIEQTLEARDLYRRLSPRQRRGLHPKVHEGVTASASLAELMILRRMHRRLKPIDPEADRDLVIGEFRASMRELQRTGPFMDAELEAKRRDALESAREVEDIDLFVDGEPSLALTGLVLPDGAVRSGASHRLADR